ncbi:MAG: 30S ribosomal protein S6 [Victivallales bacterium]|nr:30S ribosomal protein S6 [Victivallales bacterium]
MKKYEAIFILDIRKIDDEGVGITSEIEALIKKWGGEMIKSVSLGRRQFAYEIRKRKGGIYWNYIFTALPEKIEELKDHFRLDERVLRNMIINFDRPAVEKSDASGSIEVDLETEDAEAEA